MNSIICGEKFLDTPRQLYMRTYVDPQLQPAMKICPPDLVAHLQFSIVIDSVPA